MTLCAVKTPPHGPAIAGGELCAVHEAFLRPRCRAGCGEVLDDEAIAADGVCPSCRAAGRPARGALLRTDPPGPEELPGVLLDASEDLVRCSRCREDLPRAAFDEDRKRKSGLRSWCRACRRADARARYHRNAARAREVPPTKRCGGCKTTKPAEAFYRSRGSSDGLESVCRSCHQEYAAARRRRRRKEGLEPRVASKACARCREVKPAAEFYPATTATRLSSWCRSCCTAGQREHRRSRIRERDLLAAAAEVLEAVAGGEVRPERCAAVAREIREQLGGGRP